MLGHADGALISFFVEAAGVLSDLENSEGKRGNGLLASLLRKKFKGLRKSMLGSEGSSMFESDGNPNGREVWGREITGGLRVAGASASEEGAAAGADVAGTVFGHLTKLTAGREVEVG